ncbi:metallopeptidase [Xylaria intraflava]|nr:metallopeptidase [Xylaria intraflava]
MKSRLSLRGIKRRSMASFRTSPSTDTPNTSSNEEPSSRELSSVGSITPPSPIDESDSALNIQIPTSKPPIEPNSNRYSVVESVSSESHSTKCIQNRNASQYAPQLINIRDKATVNQKVLLVKGVIGQNAQPRLEGTLRVWRSDQAFPATVWPVHDGQFKALVYLLPGPNRVSFDYLRSGLTGTHSSTITVFMFNSTNSPPLQLAILVAKDSPCTFDCSLTRAKQDGNGIEAAISKFRTAAYLWQSFTADQMEKSNLGRRAFRFEEEWTAGTSHSNDLHEGTMRSEARVHVIRTDKTVAEIREFERAKQNPTANDELVKMASDTLRDYFKLKPRQKQYFAVIMMDSHWESEKKVVTGDIAYGGPVDDDLHIAIFGSHCLQSYPASLCDVAKAFTDCTPIELKVAPDANVASSSWEVASYGIGAHLHEVGRLLGSPHREKGIMANDFVTLNRAFLVREAYSTRTKSRSGPVEPKDEPIWDRLDLLHYRYHPLFQIGGDGNLHGDPTIHGWPVEKSKIIVTARSGLLYTEIFAEGDEFSTASIEYPRNEDMLRLVMLTEEELRSHLPDKKRRSKLKVIVRAMSGRELIIDDVHQLCTKSSLKLTSGPLGQLAFRSTKIGFPQVNGSPQEIIFSTAVGSLNRILTGVTVYYGNAVDGLEFHYDDISSQLFGKRGEAKERFILNIRGAEVLIGFSILAGSTIEAIRIITSSRQSAFYGKKHGGSVHNLVVPRGFKVCGVSGTCGDWIDSLGLLITR